MYMRGLSLNFVRAVLFRSPAVMIGSKMVLSTAPPEKIPPSQKDRDHIIWFDLEMTGLNPEVNKIMEVACLVTDSQLNAFGGGIDLVIHQSEEVLNGMNDWCKEHHGQSGLTERCRTSSVSLNEAEDMILEYIQKYTKKGMCPLAGNSVYMDRLFLMKYLPRVNNHMHYRIIDVSSVKELCRRWAPKTYDAAPKKILLHRALSDIEESIKELKYYKNNLFKLD